MSGMYDGGKNVMQTPSFPFTRRSPDKKRKPPKAHFLSVKIFCGEFFPWKTLHVPAAAGLCGIHLIINPTMNSVGLRQSSASHSEMIAAIPDR